MATSSYKFPSWAGTNPERLMQHFNSWKSSNNPMAGITSLGKSQQPNISQAYSALMGQLTGQQRPAQSPNAQASFGNLGLGISNPQLYRGSSHGPPTSPGLDMAIKSGLIPDTARQAIMGNRSQTIGMRPNKFSGGMTAIGRAVTDPVSVQNARLAALLGLSDPSQLEATLFRSNVLGRENATLPSGFMSGGSSSGWWNKPDTSRTTQIYDPKWYNKGGPR